MASSALELGRILLVECSVNTGAQHTSDLVLACVHLVALAGATTASQHRGLRVALPAADGCHSVVIGDLNMVEVVEGLLLVPSGQLRFEDSATEAAIEMSFGEHAEVAAAANSRRQLRDGYLDKLSHIHRRFVGMSTTDMLAVRALALYLAGVTATGMASDHAPMLACFSRPCARTSRLTMPS